jgi:hypothetical protein
LNAACRLHAATLHDVDPETALSAVRSFEGTVLVDLDETLYLRNSTEDFIDSARPCVLALLVLRLLDLIQPWRWTGGEETRDVWRVRLIRLLFPWVGRCWRARVEQLANSFSNEPLLEVLRQRREPPIVATVGFAPIVTPLVAALGLPQARIVATNSFDERRRGKARLAFAALGEDTVRKGMVITDSPQDLPLLAACAWPLRTVWPGASYRPALSHVYLPGQYLSRVKRPGERYILRGILQEDFAFWVLASLALAPYPPLHLAGLVFLLVSFWAIYERGYVDNDLIAARYESDPKLSPSFREMPVATPRLAPWVWAALCGVAALFLLRWPQAPQPEDFAIWGTVLLGTHALFWVYNRFDKGTRVWLFPGLQLARAACFTTLVPIVPVGAVALGAHVLARWMPYYAYRSGSKHWPDAPFCLTRLMFFGLLGLLIEASDGLSVLFNWSAAALLAWNLFRARPELLAALRGARRLDRPAKPGA